MCRALSRNRYHSIKASADSNLEQKLRAELHSSERALLHDFSYAVGG